jgi:uncharacterized protein
MDAWQWAELALALAAGGAVTGVLAGLFGVGGGAITVPMLFELFRLLGVSEEVGMPLAVGTSLAVIVPTSIRSALGHHARGALDADILRSWAAPIVAGVLLGALVARRAEPWVFQLAFVVVAGLLSAKLLLGKATWRLAAEMPRGAALWAYGIVIGLSSALMGIGGGALSTTIMTLHGRPIHQAVATSAGVGALIAIPGTLGYAWAGWGKAGLPPASLGFVSLLGFALVMPMALATTGIGVRLAHRLARRMLEVLFGLFLVAVSLRFLWAMLSG